jgi:predicted lipid-binding transport protein (Tim44 family)
MQLMLSGYAPAPSGGGGMMGGLMGTVAQGMCEHITCTIGGDHPFVKKSSANLLVLALL